MQSELYIFSILQLFILTCHNIIKLYLDMASLQNVTDMATKEKKGAMASVPSDTSSSTWKRPFIWNGDTSISGIKENQITHQLTLTQIVPPSALNVYPNPASVAVLKKAKKVSNTETLTITKTLTLIDLSTEDNEGPQEPSELRQTTLTQMILSQVRRYKEDATTNPASKSRLVKSNLDSIPKLFG